MTNSDATIAQALRVDVQRQFNALLGQVVEPSRVSCGTLGHHKERWPVARKPSASQYPRIARSLSDQDAGPPGGDSAAIRSQSIVNATYSGRDKL